MLLTKCSVLCFLIAASWTVCAGNEKLEKGNSDQLDPVIVSSDGNIPSAKRTIRQPPGVIRTRGQDGRYIYKKMGVTIEAAPGARVVRAYPERRGYKKPKPTRAGYLYSTTKPTKRGYVYTTPKPTRPPPIGIESTEENDSQFVTPEPPPADVSPDKDFLLNKPDDDGPDIRDSIPGTPGVDYQVYGSIPDTNFTCEGKTPGFYADPEAGCQVFHRCSDDPWYSGQYRVNMDSFLCPNGSLFNQQIYTCDWWGNVDCKGSDKFYELNEQIGQLEETSLGTIQYVQFSGARVPPPPGKKRKAPAIIPKARRDPLPEEYRSSHDANGKERSDRRKPSKGNKASAIALDSKELEDELTFRPYNADDDEITDEEGSSQTIKEIRANPPTTTRKPPSKHSGQTTRRPKPKPRQTTTESSRTRTIAYREDNIIPAAQEADPFIVNNDRDGPITDRPFGSEIPPTAEFDEGNNEGGINDAVAADPADDNVPPGDAGLDGVAPADPAGDNVPPINDEFPSPDPGGINAAGADPKEDEDDLGYVPPTSAGANPTPESVTTLRTTGRTSTTPATKKTTVASGAGGYPGSKGKGGYSNGNRGGGYSSGGYSNGGKGGGYSTIPKGGYSGGGGGGYSGGRGGGYAGGGGYKTSATNRYPAPTRGYSYPKPSKPNDNYLPPQNSVSEGREVKENADDFLTPPNREPLENENSDDVESRNFLPPDAKAELNAYVPPKDEYLPPNNKPDNTYLPPNQNAYLPPKHEYGAPNQQYGTPNNNAYLPPKQGYGTPNQQYGTPNDNAYLPPKNTYLPPKTEYSAPNQNNNEYLPPKGDYGPPNQNNNGYLPPKGDYGPPNQNNNGYLPPKGDYGPPNQNNNGYLPPKGDYGPPNQNNNGYLPPKGDYGPPKGDYGPPKGDYGPPKGDYGPPNQNNGYLPPKPEYNAPNQNNNGYLPPKDNYLPPKQDYGAPTQNAYLPPTTVDPLNTYSPNPDSYYRKPSTGYGAPVTPSYGPPAVTEPSISYGPVTEPSVSYGPVTETHSYGPPAVTEPTTHEYGLPSTPHQGGYHHHHITAPGETYGLPEPSNQYLPQSTSSPYSEYLTIPLKEYGTPQNNYNGPLPPNNEESGAAQQQNNEYIPPPATEFTTPRHDYLPSKSNDAPKEDLYFPPPQNDFNEFRQARNHETYAPQMKYHELPQFAAIRQDFREYNPQPPSQFLTEASTYRNTPYRFHSVPQPKIEFFTAPLVSYSHVVNPLNRNRNDNFFTKKK